MPAWSSCKGGLFSYPFCRSAPGDKIGGLCLPFVCVCVCVCARMSVSVCARACVTQALAQPSVRECRNHQQAMPTPATRDSSRARPANTVADEPARWSRVWREGTASAGARRWHLRPRCMREWERGRWQRCWSGKLCGSAS